MAKRFVFLWALALTPLFGVYASTARAQYVAAVNQTGYYAGEATPVAPKAPATDAAPPADAPATPVADLTGCGCTTCPVCGGGCNSCGCDKCGACFNWDKDTWVKVGAGLRATFNTVDSNLPGPGGHNTVDYFNPDNMRLYFNGQGHEYIGFEFNTDISDPSQSTFTSPNNLAEMRLLDGVIKFQFDDLVNVWIGRFLPPSDRSNLDGPFYLNVWDYPFVSNYPSVFDGRENGAAYWGQLGGGILKWQVGAFNGTQPVGAPASSDNLQFAGRVVLNLLDPEPGYYNQSTYYGKKDILALGFACMAQKNAVGDTTTGVENFFGWNFDFLFEKKLENDGVVTVEGAYYDYQDHGNIASTNTAALAQQGTAGFVTVCYLVPYQFGFGKMCGQFQPFCRWQEYDHDFSAAAAAEGQFSKGVDVGSNYILYGHNARLTAFWGQRDVPTGGNYSFFRVGAQVQF